MAKAPTKRTKAEARKRPGRKARPKNQQATSAKRMVREAVKALAGSYRLQGFSNPQITEAVNAYYGKDEDGNPTETALANPDLTAAFWRFHPTGVSRHYIHDLIIEAIADGAELLDKKQLLELVTQQMNAVMTAMLGPAMQGSVPHASEWQKLLDKFAKLIGLIESDDDKQQALVTQIFVNGALADV